MNHPDPSIDHIARERHADALNHLSPAVHMRLRPRAHTRALATQRPWGLPIAGALAALFALAVGVQWRHAPPAADGSPLAVTPAHDANRTDTRTAPAPAVAATPTRAAVASSDDEVPAALAGVEENPEFYRWLGDGDDAALTRL